MRFLVLADTHLGYETGYTSAAKEYTYEIMFKQFESMKDIAKLEKVDVVIHAGDLFNRSSPRKKVLKRAFDIIEDFLVDDYYFLIVPGNHERAKLPDTLLKYNAKCSFFSKMSTFQLDELNIIGFPFHRDDTNLLVRSINTEVSKNTNNNTLLLCHQLFVGSSFGPKNFTFKEHNGAIDTKKLSERISLIITGHVHRAQTLNNGLVVYPGSIERTSFVESIEPKGYLIIEYEKDFHKVLFKTLKTIPMEVHEFSIKKSNINFKKLQELIKPGLCRTLLRFTDRALTTDELECMKNIFPYKHYPLLVISPRFANQILKPLYNNCMPFSFPAIYKTH